MFSKEVNDTWMEPLSIFKVNDTGMYRGIINTAENREWKKFHKSYTKCYIEVLVQTFKALKKFISINILLQNFNIGLHCGIWAQIEIYFFLVSYE